jgi:hypothetical protein
MAKLKNTFPIIKPNKIPIGVAHNNVYVAVVINILETYPIDPIITCSS